MSIFNTLKQIGLRDDALHQTNIDTVKKIHLLDNVLNEETDFIDNPLFHQGIGDLFVMELPEAPVWQGEVASKKVVLTKEQERIAFLRYNFFMSLVKEKKDFLFSGPKKISKKKKIQKIQLIQDIWTCYNIAQNVKGYILACNMRLVMSQAGKFHTTYKLDIHELISTASMALMKSVEKFDVATGNKFSTYAYWSIIRMFGRLNKERDKKKNISIQITPPHPDDTLDRQHHFEPVVKQNENADSIDMISKIIEDNMANLTDLESQIIKLRFFHGDKKPSAVHVSKQLAIKPNVVYRIEQEAFAKIRSVIRDKFS